MFACSQCHCPGGELCMHDDAEGWQVAGIESPQWLSSKCASCGSRTALNTYDIQRPFPPFHVEGVMTATMRNPHRLVATKKGRMPLSRASAELARHVLACGRGEEMLDVDLAFRLMMLIRDPRSLELLSQIQILILNTHVPIDRSSIASLFGLGAPT